MVRALRPLAATAIVAGLLTPAILATASRGTADSAASGLASTTTTAGASSSVATHLLEDARLEAALADLHRLADLQKMALTGLPAAATEFAVTIPIDGEMATVQLAPHSVRSADHYRLLVDDGSGDLVAWTPGDLTTVRGSVDGRPDLLVSGGVFQGALNLIVLHPDGRRTVVEPADEAAGDASLHIVYEASSVIPLEGHRCGNEDVFEAPVPPADADADAGGEPASTGAPVEGAEFDVAELACDADFEYFLDYGTVEAVEARISLVINSMNQQYESQVDITHELTAIVVRTTINDPYTQFDSFALLCEFITEWSENQGAIPRDVAQLFTGRNVGGGTIGRAADIGGTGICVNQGGCSGGQFGTFGSYCFSESDFNGNFASATDLSAHELGHLWGAFHCSCPSFTMNPFITSANQFSNGSINSISAYRNTRECLNMPSEPIIPGPCCLPNNTCVIAEFESQCVTAGGTFLGPDADCADCTGACCLPGGGCIQIDPATCLAAGGVFAGPGTMCSDDPCAPDCPPDVDGDGEIAFGDLLAVLSAFGPCDACPEDVDLDGEVGFSDLLGVLSAFGPCP